MFKKVLFAVALMGGYSAVAEAVTCSRGCNQAIETTVTRQLSTNQNSANSTFTSNTASASGDYELHFNAGTAATWLAYQGEPTPSSGTRQSTWKYTKVDDYISVALMRSGSCHGDVYAPFNIQEKTRGNCDILNYPAPQSSINSYRSYTVNVRIDRPIVNGTYTKRILIAKDGVCQPYGCTGGPVVNNIYFSLNVTVPQTCTLNAGQVIMVNFGAISSGAFEQTGMKPEGVNPIVRNVSVDCENIEASTALTMRLQADNYSGNRLLSNNPDVGFIVEDSQTAKILIPNNLSSVIPFVLNSAKSATVGLRFYPISITGNKPAIGPVTSEAYLRVDFP